MNLRKSIVVGFDGSENSRCAIREAARIAGSNNAKLLILEVIAEQLISEIEAETGLQESDFLASREVRLGKEIESTLAPESVSSQFRSKVVPGHAFTQLMDACEQKDADLLVLGATGMTGIVHATLGAVARSAVRHAPCDTMLVRSDLAEGCSKVVCGVDFSNHSATALSRAAAIANADGARLDFVTVFSKEWLDLAKEHGDSSLDLPAKLPNDRSDEIAAELAEFVAKNLDETDGPDLHVVAVEANCPAAGLCDYALNSSADLLVIGTKGLSNDDVRPLGSTAEHVICNAHCSVLSVRSESA